jgi:MFS transporter, DHA2 family, multidrug resistance protein
MIAETGSRAGRREWIGLAVLALPTLLLALDLSALYLAVPHLSAELDAGGTRALSIMDIYGFMTAGFLVTMGTLGDRIGRRRLLPASAVTAGIAVGSIAGGWVVSAGADAPVGLAALLCAAVLPATWVTRRLQSGRVDLKSAAVQA